jgi:hypothetical protein
VWRHGGGVEWCRGWSIFPVARLVVVFGWSVGGDGMIGGGDRCVVWKGRCVVPICENCFRRLHVWWHPFHSRLILLQQTSGSFVFVRIVVVVVVRVVGRGDSDFACLVADPRGHWGCFLFVWWWWWGFRLRWWWWFCVGDRGAVLVRFG